MLEYISNDFFFGALFGLWAAAEFWWLFSKKNKKNG